MKSALPEASFGKANLGCRVTHLLEKANTQPMEPKRSHPRKNVWAKHLNI
jgi:hypothetical protein